MTVFGAFKGHVTPEIKVTITGRSMNTDPVVIPGGMTTAGAKRSGEETIQNHLEQLYGEWLLTRVHALTPAGKIKKPSVTVCLSVDRNGMAERLSRSDSEGVSRVQWMELMVICCGMALKGMDM
jgi:hypothetical protein